MLLDGKVSKLDEANPARRSLDGIGNLIVIGADNVSSLLIPSWPKCLPQLLSLSGEKNQVNVSCLRFCLLFSILLSSILDSNFGMGTLN